MTEAAHSQSATEQGSRRLISAALSLYAANPDGVDLTARPDSEWAPDVTLGDLAILYDTGRLPISTFSQSDLATERVVVELAP